MLTITKTLVVLTGLFCARSHAAPLPAAPAAVAAAPRFAALGFPALLSKTRLQGLLQSFVTAGYGHSFRHLGDERDFDHGHLLIDAKTGAPVAILYHTQELAHEAADADFGYLDPAGRNWIQWLDGRGIENARAYERTAYPSSGAWDWFVARDLPKLKARHTVTDKMLDPARLGLEELSPSRQWSFSKVDCGVGSDEGSNVLRVSLPDRTPVCLALAATF